MTSFKFTTLMLCLSFCSAVARAQPGLAGLIQSGDRAAAIAQIESGADVNLAQGDGTTPLHWAVYKIDVPLVDLLLEHDAEPDVVNRYGSSPLAEAVKTANATLVRKLLDAGADAHAPNTDGQTALMLATRVGSLEIAQLLVEHGTDVNARELWREQTALMWAADSAASDVVGLLIDRGAEVEIRAAANDWSSQITSEPRAQYRPTGGLTPLLYAARSGCTDCVIKILDAGADIDRPSPDGVTALMIALDNFNFDTAQLLLERGADPHVWDWWGRTALYVAVDISSYNGRRGATEKPAPSAVTAHDIIRLLLQAGVNPNPQLNMHRPSRGGNIGRFADDLLTTGATPLLRAAVGHDREAINLLLQHGALVDQPNVMGVTPLMAAAGVGVSGRDRSVNVGGNIETRVIPILEVLIAAGADVNAKIVPVYNKTARIARPSTMTEREGQTALFGAIKFVWTPVVEYLIANGADVDVVDVRGMTPLDQAMGRTGGRDNNTSEEIAEILRATLAQE